MAEGKKESWEGNTFKAHQIGPLKDLADYSYTLPALSMTVQGKVFLNELLELTSSEISFNALPPKKSMPFYHTHQRHEEVYIFLSGEGEFQIDGKVFPIQEGTVVRVDPAGKRTWRNTSPTDDLTFIVIQAPAGKIQSTQTHDGVALEKRVSWVNKEKA